ncbi:MAG: trimethylamine methyltransferase family protein [Anaerolineae bacterium]|nr:trimethylamine methyltransferase family protein [Anaerolineae bacterium]
MSPRFRYLDDRQRETLADAAYELLDTIGMTVTETEALALLTGAGASAGDDGRMRIPAPLVDAALDSAPAAIELYDRDGVQAFHLGGHSAHLGAHTDAPDVLDPFTGKRRPCTEADVAANARLVDRLPEMAFLTASGLVADRHPEVADRVALACCLENSEKPVLSMPVTLAALYDCHEMAALAAGDEAALRERPLLVAYAEPVSPLVHPDESLRKLIYCARHQIPVVYSGYAAMGGTGPQSPAGIVAQLCAESLGGLVVHQLAAPGAPFIFGGMASVMDMKTTLFSYGAPEFQRGVTLLTEMAHHFHLPNFGTAGTSDAQVVDGQAMIEVTSSCLLALLAGAGLVHDIGLLGSATVVVPEMIVATAEAAAMIRALVADMAVDDRALALDVVGQVGPGGEFVTHPHTLRHFRDVWYPTILYRGGVRRWQEGGTAPFERRLAERTRQLLAAPAASPLTPAVSRDLRGVVARAESEVST